MNRPIAWLATILAASAMPSCSGSNPTSPDGASCEGAKCDDAEDDGESLSCRDAIKDLSGTSRTVDDILELQDPIARAVLRQEGPCPLSVADMASVLVDSGCTDHRTALVSERSQRLGTFVDYRSITMMRCEEGDLFLHFPILAAALAPSDSAPEGRTVGELLGNVSPAIITMTAESGVFNFYQSTGSDLRFFGSSLDMLQGTDLDALEVIQGQHRDFEISFEVERSCAACHPGGGILMKELEAPWVHWEPDFDSPGADEIVSAAPDLLGRKTNGIDMEGTTRAGNDLVNDARLDHVLAGVGAEFTVGDLLRPLFCTDEFNIGSGFAAEVSQFRFSDVVVDRQLPAARIRASDTAVYDRILADRGSSLLTEAIGGPAFAETLGGFTFIHRARIDEDYVERLVARGIIDDELVRDVRVIDFTRSVYSEDRCALVAFADQVDPSATTDANPAEAIRRGLIDALRTATDPRDPELDLLANLEESGTDIDAAAQAFADACDGRTARGDVDDLLSDYVEYAAQVRKRAGDRSLGLAHGDPSFMQLRFPGVRGFALPIDPQPTREGFRLHPQTCETTTDYTRVSDGNGGGADPGGDGTPPDDVEPGDCCVTCTNSLACGNGCISKTLTCHQQPGCACEA